MSQNSENEERAEVIREDYRCDDVLATVSENDAAGEIEMDIGPSPNCTLDEFRCKCARQMDVSRFDVMAVANQNLVMHDWNHFERDTALGA